MPLCIAGHAGVGHVYSHSGFVQDDTQGLVVLAAILAEEYGLDMSVSDVSILNRGGRLQIGLRSGGRGVAHPRRGLTPQEVRLAEQLKGKNALFVQRCVLECFGRIYGNGVLEVPTSVEYALCEALLESLAAHVPGFLLERECAGGDMIGGCPAEVGGIPVTFLLTVNGSREGLGPCEDREGNVPLGAKGRVMDKLGIVMAPTVIIESKAYNPALKGLKENSFMVRYNREVDNETVGKCLTASLDFLSLPSRSDDQAFPLHQGAMRRQTESAGAALVQFGEELARCGSSSEKVSLIAEIAKYVSEDLGGIIFMSDRVHDRARSAGTMPGTSAVLSSVVTADYIREAGIPYVVPQDVMAFSQVLTAAVPLLWQRFDQARAELQSKKDLPR